MKNTLSIPTFCITIFSEGFIANYHRRSYEVRSNVRLPAVVTCGFFGRVQCGSALSVSLSLRISATMGSD